MRTSVPKIHDLTLWCGSPIVPRASLRVTGRSPVAASRLRRCASRTARARTRSVKPARNSPAHPDRYEGGYVVAASRPSYRPDVEGLRAVAVVLVVLNHLLAVPAGGFIGVDLFFVISGFVITSMLWRETAERHFTFRAFYLRRVRSADPVRRARAARDQRRRAVLLPRATGAADARRQRVGTRLPGERAHGAHRTPTTSTPTTRPRCCSTTGRWRSRSSSTSCGRS